jgi:predicted HicB family RNase H-like nuclease
MKRIKASDYIKVIEWCEKDGVFIGSAPPLIGPCCHSKNEVEVIAQLSKIVQEWIDLYEKEGRSLPEPSAGKEYSGKFILRTGEELHRLLAIRAMQEGDSLNTFVVKTLRKSAA